VPAGSSAVRERTMSRVGLRRRIVAAAALALTLVAIIGCNSVRWIGRTFPSFLVMQNRVVASVTFGDWLAIDPSRLFQNEVVAVDSVTVRSSEAVYDLVQSRPPGTTFTYTLRTPGGTSHDE